MNGAHLWTTAARGGERCAACDAWSGSGGGDIFSCDVCDITSHARCARRVDTTVACKAFVAHGDGAGAAPHAWRAGVLCDVPCAVCERHAGEGSRCLWCRRVVHTTCAEGMGGACDLGPLSAWVLPPTLVTRSAGASRAGARAAVAAAVIPPLAAPASRLRGGGTIAGRALRAMSVVAARALRARAAGGWAVPYSVHGGELPPGRAIAVVLVNCGSGGRAGQTLLTAARRLLHPLQVPLRGPRTAHARRSLVMCYAGR